jgi:hypothetical protein
VEWAKQQPIEDFLIGSLEIGRRTSRCRLLSCEPDAGKLETLRIHRLVTDFGPVDVLHSIGDGWTYEDLIGQTSSYDLEGMTVRVLNLAAIIRSKEAANRDKDRATLPILRRTLQLKEPEA